MTQASRLEKLAHVQHRTRAASVWTVEHAGILKLNLLYTVNIKMWYHPKYYKELRKRNKELQAATRDLAGAQSDQAISGKNSTEGKTRSPGPDPQATSSKPQAASIKHQAPEDS